MSVYLPSAFHKAALQISFFSLTFLKSWKGSLRSCSGYRNPEPHAEGNGLRRLHARAAHEGDYLRFLIPDGSSNFRVWDARHEMAVLAQRREGDARHRRDIFLAEPFWGGGINHRNLHRRTLPPSERVSMENFFFQSSRLRCSPPNWPCSDAFLPGSR